MPHPNDKRVAAAVSAFRRAHAEHYDSEEERRAHEFVAMLDAVNNVRQPPSEHGEKKAEPKAAESKAAEARPVAARGEAAPVQVSVTHGRASGH